ncbi:hypothetical protein [Clostridium sp. ZS2-4]|uniref:hypothetical protein n=1 Tax=Clostridium sp. ZS2-4 TaxID=2987703 RepID=UPI00227AE63C|nr:hypothetical protein [Clostridium sp. ZS2-4]MCY6356386.1 hypothetical protein [Clostridium sp. ZS2-4]
MILSMYDGIKWSERKILKNSQSNMLDIYFKAVLRQNQLNIFYSILNKKTKITTFFHQTVDKEFKLSTPKVVDNIKSNDNMPFIIHTDNNNMLILYQKLTDKYEIGYKQLIDKEWSNFYTIERNTYPYTDYSLLYIKDILHLLYVKNNKNSKSLMYFRGQYPNFYHNELFQSANIDSCSLFMLKNNIWINWIDNNTIYSSFSINNGEKFSIPPHHELITSPNIIKAIYISNFSLDKEYIVIHELYIDNQENLTYLMIPNIYPYIVGMEKNVSDKNYNSYWIYIKNYMNKAYEKILNVEKLLKQKEMLITELKYTLKDQKVEMRTYENKFNDINKKYVQCEDDKELLNENINSLQELLISRDRQINELENVNLEKENQIISLNNKITELEKNFSYLKKDFIAHKDKIAELEYTSTLKENEILSLKNNINLQNNKIMYFETESENLKNQLCDLESKFNSSNLSIFKKIFGNNE